jgi:hypothetical protein
MNYESENQEDSTSVSPKGTRKERVALTLTALMVIAIIAGLFTDIVKYPQGSNGSKIKIVKIIP